MLSFIYTYSLQQPLCIMVSMVLLRCYQYLRCYDHIWDANCKVIQGQLYLEGDPYNIFILQSLQICPCARYTKYKHICNDLSFCSFKVTFTIYLFSNICRFALVLSTNILTMIFLSSFKVTFTIYLFYNFYTLVLGMLSTKIFTITFLYLLI